MLFLNLMLNFSSSAASDSVKIILPEPRHKSSVSIEETMLHIKSVRQHSDRALSIQEVAQLLWAAQGIKNTSGKRTAPSAGATYPLEVYAIAGNIEGITRGIYKYKPHQHELIKTMDVDYREALTRAALNQQFIAQAPLNIIITAVYERTTGRYGGRGIRYVHMEAGHAAQNVCLQAVAMNLGAVVVGAFDDNQVAKALKLPDDEVPLYIIPVGKPAD